MFTKIFPFLISLGISFTALAGAGSSGGGADYQMPTDGSAWYLGRLKTISVCVEQSSAFGAPIDSNTRNLFESVFLQWHSYIDRNLVEFNRDLNHPKTYLDNSHRLASKLRFLDTCDGTEDLTLYFGPTPPRVATALREFNDPVSIAYRESYNSDLGWGKGFIWIRSFRPGLDKEDLWANVQNLRAALMHEVGHVLGCGHVIGTVMDPRFRSILDTENITWPNPMGNDGSVNNRQLANFYSSHIDGNTHLVNSFSNGGVISGEVYSHGDLSDLGQLAYNPEKTFKQFIGRTPIGKVSAQISLMPSTSSVGEYSEITLTYEDSVSVKRLPLKMRKNSVQFAQTASEPVFKIYIKNDYADLPGLTQVVPASGAVFEGYIKDAKSKMRPVTLSINNGSANKTGRWIQLDYALGLDDHPLFRNTAEIK